VVKEGADRAGAWGSCIKVSPPGNGVNIIGNRIAPTCYGEAVGVTMGKNVIVKNNIVEDSFLLSYYVDNSENVLVDSNFTYCTKYPQAKAIAIGAERYGSEWNWTNVLKNVTIQNNISNGCMGIYGWYGDTPTIPTNIKIQNNTMMNVKTGGGIAIASVSGQTYTILNNVYSGAWWIASMTGVTASNNIVQGSLLAGGDITNPLSAKLVTDKTGIDSGLQVDFSGNARSLPMSVGAWEYDGTYVTPLPPTVTGSPAPATTTGTPSPTRTQSPSTSTKTPRFTRTPTGTRVPPSATNTPALTPFSTPTFECLLFPAHNQEVCLP
jgi:hypothetical protein